MVKNTVGKCLETGREIEFFLVLRKQAVLCTILFEDIFGFTAQCCLEEDRTHLSVNMQRARKVLRGE